MSADGTGGGRVRLRRRTRRARWRRAGAAAAALLALLTAVAGCSGGGPAGDRDGHARTGGGAGEIRIATGTDLSSGGIRQELIEEAARQLDLDVKVTVVELPDDTDRQRSQLAAALQAGNRDDYDIVNLDVTWTAEFAAEQLIEPLEGDLAGLDVREETDIWPSVRDTVEYGGKAWAVPWNTDVGLLYYRADKIGDESLRTWRQLDGTVRRHEPSGTDRGKLKAGLVTQLDSYEGLTVNTHEAVWRHDGDIVDGEHAVRVAEQNAQRGLQELSDAFTKDAPDKLPLLGENSLRSDETGAVERFLAGEALTMRNWPFAKSRIEEHLQKPGPGGDPPRYGITALPDGSAPGQSGHAVLGGQNLAIAAGSPDSADARRLVKQITSNGELAARLYDGGFVPARKSAVPGGCSHRGWSLPARAPEGTLEEQYVEALCWSMEHARPRPATPYYAAVTRDIQDVMSKRLSAAPSAPPVDEHATPGDLRQLLRKSLNGW